MGRATGGRLTRDYLWDNDGDACRYAQIEKCKGGLILVGSRLPNGYKLYDMIGNAWEWTASPWRTNRNEIPANGRDTAGGSESRVLRGASSDNQVQGGGGDGGAPRLSGRGNFSPGSRGDDVGFRLVARIAP